MNPRIATLVNSVLNSNHSINKKESIIEAILTKQFPSQNYLFIFGNSAKEKFCSKILEMYAKKLVIELEKTKYTSIAIEDYQKSIINADIRNLLLKNDNFNLLCKLANQDAESVMSDFEHVHHSHKDEELDMLKIEIEKYEEDMREGAYSMGFVITGLNV